MTNDQKAPFRAASTRARPRFFLVLAMIALALAIAGFSKTFFFPVAMGAFDAPLIIYLHGGFAFGWVIIFAIQPWLIRAREFRHHAQLGFAGLFAAIGFALTALPVGAYAAARDQQVMGEAGVSTIVGTGTAALVFLVLVGAGILMRKDGAAHKRLMLLATLHLLWPAWFRFRHYFPDVPSPEIIFAIVLADSLIVIAALRDWIVDKRVHKVWLIGGTLVIADHIIESMLFDTPGWRFVANILYGWFAPPG